MHSKKILNSGLKVTLMQATKSMKTVLDSFRHYESERKQDEMLFMLNLPENFAIGENFPTAHGDTSLLKANSTF